MIIRTAAAYAIQEGELTLGSDNGSAFTRRFRTRLGELGIRPRPGGYRDPGSQAFVERWFRELKQREVWLHEYETLDDARRGIGGYVDRYHPRPHSGLIPDTRRGAPDMGGWSAAEPRPSLSTPAGSRSDRHPSSHHDTDSFADEGGPFNQLARSC